MKAAGVSVICAALIFSTAHAAVSNAVSVSHHESLQKLSITRSASHSGLADRQKAAVAGATAGLTFDAFGRTFDLQLESNDRLLPAASRRALPGDVEFLRGSDPATPESWVRLVIADGIPRGIIWDGSELFAVEAPGDSAVSASEAVIYRLADTYVAPGMMSCGTAGATSAAGLYDNLLGELDNSVAKSEGAVSQLRIGAIGDFEFFDAKGRDAQAAILTRLNNVDGIYSEQLGVQIVVDELQIFTTPADPFSSVTDAGELLTELGKFRAASPAQRSKGLTHLYTGRDLDERTVGIAYINQLCNARYGAGLSRGSTNATFDSLVAAHEIGHNFGAPHDGEPGSACIAENGKHIMASTLNGSDTFSQCSMEQMRPKISAAACIAPLPTVDVSVELDGALDPMTLNHSESISVVVANGGGFAASNVMLEIAVPAIVSLDSATASQGACTSGAGVVACDLDSVPAGSIRSVTLALTAVDAGKNELLASVAADGDTDSGNNELVAPLTVEPLAEAAEAEKSAAAGGGGGGAVSMLPLALLASGTLIGRKRRRTFTFRPGAGSSAIFAQGHVPSGHGCHCRGRHSRAAPRAGAGKRHRGHRRRRSRNAMGYALLTGGPAGGTELRNDANDRRAGFAAGTASRGAGDSRR